MLVYGLAEPLNGDANTLTASPRVIRMYACFHTQKAFFCMMCFLPRARRTQKAKLPLEPAELAKPKVLPEPGLIVVMGERSLNSESIVANFFPLVPASQYTARYADGRWTVLNDFRTSRSLIAVQLYPVTEVPIFLLDRSKCAEVGY